MLPIKNLVFSSLDSVRQAQMHVSRSGHQKCRDIGAMKPSEDAIEVDVHEGTVTSGCDSTARNLESKGSMHMSNALDCFAILEAEYSKHDN